LNKLLTAKQDEAKAVVFCWLRLNSRFHTPQPWWKHHVTYQHRKPMYFCFHGLFY